MFSVIIYTETLLPVLSLYSRVAAFRVGMGGGVGFGGFGEWGLLPVYGSGFRFKVLG